LFFNRRQTQLPANGIARVLGGEGYKPFLTLVSKSIFLLHTVRKIINVLAAWLAGLIYTRQTCGS
jgi:hypothetical protein